MEFLLFLFVLTVSFPFNGYHREVCLCLLQSLHQAWLYSFEPSVLQAEQIHFSQLLVCQILHSFNHFQGLLQDLLQYTGDSRPGHNTLDVTCLHKDCQEGKNHLSEPEKKDWELGIFSLEEFLGRPYSCLPVPKGGLQESWTGTLHQGML